MLQVFASYFSFSGDLVRAWTYHFRSIEDEEPFVLPAERACVQDADNEMLEEMPLPGVDEEATSKRR